MTRRPKVRRDLGLERLESREVLSTLVPGTREQYMLELVNQARTNPRAAAVNYTTGLDNETLATVRYFDVDLGQVREAIASSPPQQPLAWNPALAEAALSHSRDQANGNFQSHTGSDGSDPNVRARRAGYGNAAALTENAFAYADSVDNALDAFLIDWGTDGGHRRNLLQPGVPADDSFRDVGLGLVDDTDLGTGPLVVTQVLGRQQNARPNLLGVAYDDRDRDGGFSFNEGVGGVEVEVRNRRNGQVQRTQTWESGGWQVEVEPGSYDVSARRNGQLIGSQQAEAGSRNVKIDFETNARPTPPAPTPTPPAPVIQALTVHQPVVSVSTPPAPAVTSRPAPTPPPPTPTPIIEAISPVQPVSLSINVSDVQTVVQRRPTLPFGSSAVLLSYNSWKVR